MGTLVEGKRAAYVAVMADRDLYMVALCIENVNGFRPIDDYAPGPEEKMHAIADRLNEGIGVTRDEAIRIALTTMKTLVAPFRDKV